MYIRTSIRVSVDFWNGYFSLAFPTLQAFQSPRPTISIIPLGGFLISSSPYY
jgi:hypothetical protein